MTIQQIKHRLESIITYADNQKSEAAFMLKALELNERKVSKKPLSKQVEAEVCNKRRQSLKK